MNIQIRKLRYDYFLILFFFFIIFSFQNLGLENDNIKNQENNIKINTNSDYRINKKNIQIDKDDNNKNNDKYYIIDKNKSFNDIDIFRKNANFFKDLYLKD